MKMSICIGSSCHLKGSKAIVETMQRLIAEHNIGDKLTLEGVFCMGKCEQGVCTKLDGTFFSLTPESCESFFNNEILPRV